LALTCANAAVGVSGVQQIACVERVLFAPRELTPLPAHALASGGSDIWRPS